MSKLINLILATSEFSQTTYIDYLDHYGIRFRFYGVPYKAYGYYDKLYNELIKIKEYE